jgi:hypothetical protein
MSKRQLKNLPKFHNFAPEWKMKSGFICFLYYFGHNGSLLCEIMLKIVKVLKIATMGRFRKNIAIM